VESGGADPAVVAERINDQPDVDIWGFSEVQNQWWATTFEQRADQTGSDFGLILNTTGGGDRLAIPYNDDKLDLVSSEELGWINVGGNVRAPLVGRFEHTASGTEFLFVANHLPVPGRPPSHPGDAPSGMGRGADAARRDGPRLQLRLERRSRASS